MFSFRFYDNYIFCFFFQGKKLPTSLRKVTDAFCWSSVLIETQNGANKRMPIFVFCFLLQHANIVNFHKFWTDARSETPRVIFITEYMTSGSLKQFLKKTRKSNYKTLNEKVNSKTCIVLIHSFVCSLSLLLKSLGLSLSDQTVSFTGLEKVVEANFVSSKVTACLLYTSPSPRDQA